ncbi:MAG TPA: sensor domain-containing diguanylate cyclase [Gallionellaceae bacterium]|nr:sensor domain-containing diguanylate cyclase [Gallionellaceae bacterium]
MSKKSGGRDSPRTKAEKQLDSKKVLKESKGAAERIMLTDMIERKRVDDASREQEAFFRMIAEHSDDFIAVLDLKGRRLYNSPSYARLFGDVESIKGTDSFAEIHPDDREHIKQVFRETVQSRIGMKADFRIVLADGSIRHMESRGGLIRNNQGQVTHIVVVSRDVTERKQADQDIYNLAFYDVLTGNPNRRLLNDRLAQAMAASTRSRRYGALMFIDLDKFKPLNDQNGHAVGDLLLQEVARRISNCVRKVDTLSRFGGDEFVVLLSELNVDNAKSIKEAGMVAEKIRIALAEPYILTDRQEGKAEVNVTHQCTASIGIYLFINNETSVNEILKRADLAMYRAKDGGGNLICFFDSFQPMQFNLRI